MIKLLKKILAKKIILVIVIVLMAVGGYFGYQKFKGGSVQEVKYVTSAAVKGMITTSVSGTGQVSVLDQVEIKPEASGKAVYIGVQNGQAVKSGDLIAQLDATDAVKSVRDAQANLDSAKLSLEKLNKPADPLDIAKAQNSLSKGENILAKAQEAEPNAEADLAKTYEDGFNDVANAFLDLPTIMSGLDDILLGNDFSAGQVNMYYYSDGVREYDDSIIAYRNDAYNKYIIARDNYDKNFEDYKNSSRRSEADIIENLIDETYDTTKDIADAIQSINNFIDFYQDLLAQNSRFSVNSTVTNHQNTLESDTGTTNSHLSGLSADKNSIDSSKENIIDAKRTIEESQRAVEESQGNLDTLLAGTDEYDIQSQQLSVKQKENALLDAQQKLADYYVRAPFDGIIAELNVRKGESVSSGTSVATLITSQKIAEINLNEIDTAQVKVGQKVILTFDAIEDLSITGQVAEVDTLGTVSSGVVSYGIKISFDVQDERIKPGMSLSANIIVESKQNVLSVPISAVKTLGTSSYVEVLVNGQLERKTVTVGISSDTMSEIIDGIAEGDQVITQTINGSASSSTNTNTSQSGSNNAMRGVFQLNGGGGQPR